MRTTVTLDEDVLRAVEELRRREGLRISAAVNALVRRGLASSGDTATEFRQQVSAMGEPRIALDDIGAVLGYLDDVERP